MGTEGTEQGIQRDLVLDAGALIALERDDEAMVALIEQASERWASIVIPATALAQVWRGGPRSASVARLLKGADLDCVCETRAKEIGLRLGARDRKDIADAHVVCCAAQRGAIVATSDPDDIAFLASAGEQISMIGV